MRGSLECARRRDREGRCIWDIDKPPCRQVLSDMMDRRMLRALPAAEERGTQNIGAAEESQPARIRVLETATSVHPHVSLETGKTPADIFEQSQVNAGGDDAGPAVTLGKDLSPRVDDG